MNNEALPYNGIPETFVIRGRGGEHLPVIQTETGFTGLEVPFGILPDSFVPDSYPPAVAENAARGELYTALTEGLDRVNLGTNGGSERYDRNTPVRPIPMSAVLRQIFPQHIGTKQEGINQAVMRGLLSFVGQHVKDPEQQIVKEVGGGVRKVSGMLLPLSHPWKNTDECARILLARWNQSPLAISDGEQSEIPEYEADALAVRQAMIQPNADLKAYCTREDIPLAGQSVADSLQDFLTNASVPHNVYATVDENGNQTGAEIHISLESSGAVNDYFNPARVYGWKQNDPGSRFDEKRVYLFSPVEDPDRYVIKIQYTRPSINPGWTQLCVTHGIANTKGFLDVTKFYFSPFGVEGDQRSGDVDSRQNIAMTYFPDGSVRVPAPEEYWAHETETVGRPDRFTDINKLISRFSRPLRHFVKTVAQGTDLCNPDHSPSGKGMGSVTEMFSRMVELHQFGQNLNAVNRIDMFTNLTAAINQNYRDTVSFLNSWIPSGLRSHIFPRFAVTRVMRDMTSCRLSPDGIVFAEDSEGNYQYASGITKFLDHLQYELDILGPSYADFMTDVAHLPPDFRLPNGSPLARVLYLLDMFPNNL